MDIGLQSIRVGNKNASQNPTYFSAKTMAIDPVSDPTLIIR
jgi:hypothetical protein